MRKKKKVYFNLAEGREMRGEVTSKQKGGKGVRKKKSKGLNSLTDRRKKINLFNNSIKLNEKDYSKGEVRGEEDQLKCHLIKENRGWEWSLKR